MADIAPKLLHLSAEKLVALHERIHKSEISPAALEVHHTLLNEMARRKMERPKDDWDSYEILIDSIDDVEIASLSDTFPPEMLAKMVAKIDSTVGNLRTYLTVNGYSMRVEGRPLDPIEKMIRHEGGKWVVYNEQGTRKFGSYKTKDEAEERLAQIHAFSKASYTPPKGVRDAARRAVDWISEGKAGSGFTSVGRTRASQLAAGEAISIETLKRMKSFFSRHEVDKDALGFTQGEKGFPTPGRVAWDAWGGDAGFSWAKEMVSRYENGTLEKHLQGQHDQKAHAPKYARGIADEINAGGHPSVLGADVGALFEGFSKLTDHPDLTELKVEGTMLFGDEGMGIARKDMPQIPAERRDEFLSDLAKEGVKTTEESIDPKTLKPIQKEVSGSRSGAIYMRYKENGAIPDQQRILISSDGYVIDGHHTWGAAVAFSFDNPSATLPVYRIDLTAKEALSASNQWADAKGMARQALDAKEPTNKALFVWKHLDGQHDQSTHGSWAGGGEASAEELASRRSEAIARGDIPGYRTDANGRIENPDATGGYKAGIPESVEFAGTTFTPKDSLWHHLVPDGEGGFEPSQERAYLHQQIIAQVTGNVPESQNPTFHMLGGGPASGKTTVIKSGQTDIPSKSEAVHINADDAKEMLPENGRMRMSQDDRDYFHAAEFVHEESSILAKRIQSRAIDNKQDIVLDGTGDSAISKLGKKVEQARQAGYKVNGVYVTIPTETAWERASGRALGESRRYVPESVVRSTHADVSRTLPLAIEGGLFDKVTLFDNSGSTVKKIGEGTGSEFVIYDAKGWSDFLAKGKP